MLIEGYKYLKLFLYTLHELEHNDIKHGNMFMIIVFYI